MSSLARFHADFADAVLSGDASALWGHLTSPSFAGRALVYRNNMYAAAVGALASAYPAVAAAAGPARFRALAGRYVDLRPPRTRSLVGYGRDCALILRNSHEPDAARLADLARLDRAWLEAHLAPEDRALQASDLQDLPPAALLQSKPALRASVRFVLASGDVADAWSRARFGAAAPGAGGSATTLLWRPRGEVARRQLGEGEAQFLLGLAAGDPLDFAARAAMAAQPDFDLAQAFAAALAAEVFAAPASSSLTEIPS